MNDRLRENMIVIHPNRPEWGPGRIIHIVGQIAHVVFRDLPEKQAKAIRTDVIQLQLAPKQQDDILDNLPPLVARGERFELPAERLTAQHAIDAFMAQFPLAFQDPKYIENERQYKWDAHLRFVDELGNGQLLCLIRDDLEELARRAMRCVSMVNVVYPIEQAAMRDALQQTKLIQPFFERLADLLDAKTVDENCCQAYFSEVTNLPQMQGRVATWPVATVLPFLARPDRHLFIKPSITNAAANRLGFHLNYRSEPNWLTYKCALNMAGVYKTKIAHLHPQDLIDVQSFFWVTCGGYEDV